MNNSPYIHYKNGKKELINLYFIAIIPLILYGIYKNGILLYINDLINIKEVFIQEAKDIFEKTLGVLQNCDNEDEFEKLLLEETVKKICKKEEEEE